MSGEFRQYTNTEMRKKDERIKELDEENDALHDEIVEINEYYDELKIKIKELEKTNSFWKNEYKERDIMYQYARTLKMAWHRRYKVERDKKKDLEIKLEFMRDSIQNGIDWKIKWQFLEEKLDEVKDIIKLMYKLNEEGMIAELNNITKILEEK